jgi:hypothetical protein
MTAGAPSFMGLGTPDCTTQTAQVKGQAPRDERRNFAQRYTVSSSRISNSSSSSSSSSSSGGSGS